MDARVSDLFGSGNGPSSRPQVVASNGKPGNGRELASKKANAKNYKKAKARLSRNFRPSNNIPYLPPEVSLNTLFKPLRKLKHASIIYQ